MCGNTVGYSTTSRVQFHWSHLLVALAEKGLQTVGLREWEGDGRGEEERKEAKAVIKWRQTGTVLSSEKTNIIHKQTTEKQFI